MKYLLKKDSKSDFLALLSFNLIVFFIGKFFDDNLTVVRCLIYSLVNSTWMLFILIPAIDWLNKRKSYYRKQKANIESSRKVATELRSLINDFNQKQKTIQQALENDVYLIEENTPYSKKLIEVLLNDFTNFGFSHIKSISNDFVKSKTKSERNRLWNELNNGVEILQTPDQLSTYIYSYGKMHELKLNDSFRKLFSQINFSENSKYSVIDYGCGQGIATTVFLDYLKRFNLNQKQIDKIILIEPSLLALKRCSLNVLTTLKTLKQNPKIETVNKQIDGIDKSELATNKSSVKLHLFSNILDIEGFDIRSIFEKICVSQSGENIFICISPKINSIRNDRLDYFYNLFLALKPELISNRNNPIHTLTKSYQRHEIIFKVNL